VNDQRVPFVAPGGWLFDRPIIRAGHEHDGRTIRLKPDAFARSARQRDVVILRTINSSLIRIFLEDVNPGRAEQSLRALSWHRLLQF
jgi:hypothetical protein